jgi:hypothetical protein
MEDEKLRIELEELKNQIEGLRLAGGYWKMKSIRSPLLHIGNYKYNISAENKLRVSPATFNERPFGILDDYRLSQIDGEVKSSVWMETESGRLPGRNSQRMIQGFIHNCLTDLFRLAGVGDRLQVTIEPYVTDLVSALQSGILTIRTRSGNFPAIFQIPSQKGDLEDAGLISQIGKQCLIIRNQMLEFHYMHGLDFVCAIVTSYTEWIIFWLPDTDVMAASNILDHTKCTTADYSNAKEFVLSSTKTYLFNDVELIETLISLSVKLSQSNSSISKELVQKGRK